MTRTEKLIDTIARLNPDAGEIGAGMLANIVAEARAIQAESKPSKKRTLMDLDSYELNLHFDNLRAAAAKSE